MNIGEIKKKASEFFTEYLNKTIDKICCSPDGHDGSDVEDFFPLEILRNTERFSESLKDVSPEVADIFLYSKDKTGVGYSLEMETVQTRSNGRKSILKRVYFAEENDYLDYIGIRDRVENLKSALEVLYQDEVLPYMQLRNWAKKHVKDLTVFHKDGLVFWHNITQCVFYANDTQNDKVLHVSVDFMERHKKIVQSFLEDERDWLPKPAETEVPVKNEPPVVEEAAPLEKKMSVVKSEAAEIEPISTGEQGSLRKPFSIRFRSLSKQSPLKFDRLVPKEISFTLHDFIRLNYTDFLKGITTVLIVNDETVFQTFPPSEHVFCIYGPDYAVNALKLCEWFAHYQLIYFGDISEHCFDVLSAFRNTWMKTESMCMDGNTWEKFFNSAEPGARLKNDVVPRNLTESERNTFLSLRLTAEKGCLRQEKIPPDYMSDFLNSIKTCGSDVVEDSSASVAS